MQTLKLSFARRVLGISWRPDQPSLYPTPGPARVWQRRIYDFNVWTERKRIREAALHASQSSEAGLAAEPDQVRLNGWEVLEMEVGDTG